MLLKSRDEVSSLLVHHGIQERRALADDLLDAASGEALCTIGSDSFNADVLQSLPILTGTLPLEKRLLPIHGLVTDL